MDLREIGLGVILTGFIWLRIQISAGVFSNKVHRTFKFHELLGNSCAAERLVAFQVGRGSTELAS
jgi:hypothetical protein